MNEVVSCEGLLIITNADYKLLKYGYNFKRQSRRCLIIVSYGVGCSCIIINAIQGTLQWLYPLQIASLD